MSKPFRIPLRYRAQRTVRRVVPLLFWTACLVFCVFLWQRQSFRSDVAGLAQEMRYGVSPIVKTRLQSLEVTLHERVNKGQLLAIFDDQALRGQLETARAELRRLRDDLTRERGLQATRTSDSLGKHTAELRRFASDIEQTELQRLALSTRIAEDEANKQGLELRLERSRGLADKELGSSARVESQETELVTIKARLAATRIEQKSVMKRLVQARERYEAWRKAARPTLSIESLIRPFEQAVRVQELRLEELRLAMRRLALRSPATGVVAAILRRPGENVEPNEPCIEIVEEEVREIVAWLPELRIGEVVPGQEVEIRSRRNGKLRLDSQVRAVGASLEELPPRLQIVGGRRSFGQAIYVDLPASVHALPGEAFDVSFGVRRSSPSSPATPR